MDKLCETLPKELEVRTFHVRTNGNRIEAIATTESPVPMFDYERYEVVPETLLMSGVDLPERIPLLDSHNRDRVKDILGSARNLRIEGDKLILDIDVSNTEADVKKKIDEKHITDLSIGYSVLKKLYVPEDETAMIDGRAFSGPMNVATQWELREVSLTPIGADQLAKIRKQQHGGTLAKEETKNQTKPENEPEANNTRSETKKEETPKVEQPKAEERQEATKPRKRSATQRINDSVQKALKEQRDRFAAIRNECKRHGIEADADELCEKYESVAEARAAILDILAKRAPTIRTDYVRFGASEVDKTNDAMRDGLAVRCGLKKTDEKELAPGWQDFRNATLLDLAKANLERNGVRVRGLSNHDIATQALTGSVRGADYGFHTGADFTNLLLDAANKSLLQGYEEAPVTWRQCFRQAPSVSDFKAINRVRLSEAPSLDVWPDNSEPNQLSLSDQKESYNVEAYSNIISISYQTLVNDDLDALSRVPQLLGAAAARTVNATAWAIITSNPAMADGYNLFDNTNHANDVSSGGVPGTTELNTMRAKLRTQTGMNGATLGLVPRYLVGPAALESSILQITNSEYDPTASKFQVFNPNRNLVPVIEPILDSNSTKKWYLFADPSQIDTIEVSFLQGQESPIIRSWTDQKTLSMNFHVLQSFGTKAVDHRGVHRNAGE
ncbi:phage major capsid protein [Thalassoroseus pseudoceratinae]|uniref:phage major capsid protein n=1 Tax=Thalassoroseus pseudoceratinae TaxID=2713176 RepID=UPI0014207FC1|nr:hypothetical protein [Thalassoroseus pseudoceratinae]